MRTARSLLPLLLPVLSFAQTDPVRELVAKTRAALESARYAGVRRVEMRREGQTRVFKEIVSRSGPRIRIEYQGGPFEGQITVEDGRERRTFYPGRNEIVVSAPRSREGVGRLLKSRRLRLEGEEKVAGRNTVVLVGTDASGNARQRSYVDAVTGVVLKRVVLDAGGAPVGGFEFLSVDYTPRLPEGLFTLERRGAKIVRPRDTVLRMAKAGGFLPEFLPEGGYMLDGARVMDVLGQSVLAQSYIKEGSRLTFFQTLRKIDPSRLRKLARPGLQVRTWSKNGREFVLIGSASGFEMDRIARAAAS